MLRLYVRDAPTADGTLRITGGELRHLHTLRLGPGDRLVLFDAAGAEHEAVLDHVSTREALARVVATTHAARESTLELVLAAALLKQDKMDWVVEKATELGVTRVVPILTRYVVGRGSHVERWRRIAVAAAKQSGRTRVPGVDAPVPLASVLDVAWPGLRLLACEDEGAVRLRDLPAAAAAVVVLIGPEGGFHADEAGTARTRGFVTMSLGRRVLRAETAAVTAVALCQHRWGDG